MSLLRTKIPCAFRALCSASFGLLAGSCLYTAEVPDIEGRDIRVTFLHTSDIHSRVLPYAHEPNLTERRLGLAEGRESYGGLARIAHVIKREKKQSSRALWVDTGDLFQGAPIFNEF
jgi:2',3'-cyclic-nucleotide 2'-phosphodiesterase (5'-nucleotidase family)